MALDLERLEAGIRATGELDGAGAEGVGRFGARGIAEDRGTGNAQRPSPKPATKPTQMNRPSPGMQQGGNRANRGTAMSGAGGNRGGANAASQRGKQSMPQGARSKGGGGGGGKKKAR